MPESTPAVQMVNGQIRVRSESHLSLQAPQIGLIATLTLFLMGIGSVAQAQLQDPGFQQILPERISIPPVRINPIPRASIIPQYVQINPIPRTNILPERLLVQPLEISPIQLRPLTRERIVPQAIERQEATAMPEAQLRQIERGVDVPRGYRSPILHGSSYLRSGPTASDNRTPDYIRRQPLGW